jgi:hypothetical protein
MAHALPVAAAVQQARGLAPAGTRHPGKGLAQRDALPPRQRPRAMGAARWRAAPGGRRWDRPRPWSARWCQRWRAPPRRVSQHAALRDGRGVGEQRLQPLGADALAPAAHRAAVEGQAVLSHRPPSRDASPHVGMLDHGHAERMALAVRRGAAAAGRCPRLQPVDAARTSGPYSLTLWIPEFCEMRLSAPGGRDAGMAVEITRKDLTPAQVRLSAERTRDARAAPRTTSSGARGRSAGIRAGLRAEWLPVISWNGARC